MSWTQENPRRESNPLGVYISVPFCRSKCTYCNFASGVYPARDHDRYVARLIDDLTSARRWTSQIRANLPHRVDTVYLGGGTPTLLAAELFTKLFGALRADFGFDADAEITVECAPGQLADETLEAMVAAGVNRVSLGVQSFVDREAHETGRLHNRSGVMRDLDRLRAAGIDNLNIDLIAGLPGQTFASWDESLQILIDCSVPHASVYMLEVDEDSRLGREMLNGGTRYHAGLVPSDEAIAQMYETAMERLAAAGIEQYEISNFARPGFESRHNLRYWLRRPYLGLGLDASSALEAEDSFVLRAKTTDDLKAYLAGTESAETAWLSLDRQLEEAWFLGLRLNRGVETAALACEFGWDRVRPGIEVANRLAADGLLTVDEKRIRLTAQGRLLSNEVFEQFLGIHADESNVELTG
jgi:oxygen-independent coproporphyrinogen III oxidase